MGLVSFVQGPDESEAAVQAEDAGNRSAKGRLWRVQSEYGCCPQVGEKQGHRLRVGRPPRTLRMETEQNAAGHSLLKCDPLPVAIVIVDLQTQPGQTRCTPGSCVSGCKQPWWSCKLYPLLEAACCSANRSCAAGIHTGPVAVVDHSAEAQSKRRVATQCDHDVCVPLGMGWRWGMCWCREIP